MAKPKLEQSLMGFYSFSKVLKEKGMNPKDIILGIEEVSPTKSIQKALQLNEDEAVVEIKRLRCAGDEPIILESSYLPQRIVSNLSRLQKVGEISLYDLLAQEFQIVIKRAKETFEPVLVKENESDYLR